MAHQCVRCNIFYEDGAHEILKGCSCGGRLFFYVKNEKLKKAKEVSVNLTDEEKHQIEQDVLELVGAEDNDAPVVLDIESIRVVKPGKFELDLVQLFNKENPLVYKLADGKYIIDIPETFQRRSELKEEKKK